MSHAKKMVLVPQQLAENLQKQHQQQQQFSPQQSIQTPGNPMTRLDSD